MEELLHGDWYGIEVTNHLIAQGLWDTLHHSITDLIGSFDTLNGTFVVDSLGKRLDSADLVIDNSIITISGAVNAVTGHSIVNLLMCRSTRSSAAE